MAKLKTEEMEPMDESDPQIQPPDPWAVLSRLTAAIEAVASQRQGGNDEVMQTLVSAMSRMADTQISQVERQREENQRQVRPSNAVVPNRSAFNQRGELLAAGTPGLKPPLKCLTMLPWLAEWNSLTREEVMLLNLVQAGTYTVKRVDDTRVPLTVTISYKEDGKTPSTMLFNHETGFNQDNFRLMPTLNAMLRQMLTQHDRAIAQQAAAVLTEDEERALILAGELTVSV